MLRVPFWKKELRRTNTVFGLDHSGPELIRSIDRSADRVAAFRGRRGRR